MDVQKFYVLILFLSGLLLIPYCSSAKIPVTLWKEMKMMKTPQQFIERFIRKNNGSLDLIQDDYDKQMEELLFTKEGNLIKDGLDITVNMIAEEDACKPHPVSVETGRSLDPNILYWPSMTTVEQCMGGCNDDNLNCVPILTEDYLVQVIRARYPKPGADSFIFEGLESKVIQRHLLCQCTCKIQPQQCNKTLHRYDEDLCACRCHNENTSNQCGANRKWDNDKCQCVCKHIPKCVFREIFVPTSCRCEGVTTAPTETTSHYIPTPPVDFSNPCQDQVCRAGYKPRRIGQTCRCEFSSHVVISGTSYHHSLPGGIPILPHYIPPSQQHSNRVNRYPVRRTYNSP